MNDQMLYVLQIITAQCVVISTVCLWPLRLVKAFDPATFGPFDSNMQQNQRNTVAHNNINKKIFFIKDRKVVLVTGTI
jgi:hypothetical protein